MSASQIFLFSWGKSFSFLYPLDHDLGDDLRGTGYGVILWIEKAVVLEGFCPPKITVHSANVSARRKMEQGIEKIRELPT